MDITSYVTILTVVPRIQDTHLLIHGITLFGRFSLYFYVFVDVQELQPDKDKGKQLRPQGQTLFKHIMFLSLNPSLFWPNH